MKSCRNNNMRIYDDMSRKAINIISVQVVMEVLDAIKI